MEEPTPLSATLAKQIDQAQAEATSQPGVLESQRAETLLDTDTTSGNSLDVETLQLAPTAKRKEAPEYRIGDDDDADNDDIQDWLSEPKDRKMAVNDTVGDVPMGGAGATAAPGEKVVENTVMMSENMLRTLPRRRWSQSPGGSPQWRWSSDGNRTSRRRKRRGRINTANT